MVMTAWEVAGLEKDYWCQHALDIRIRLAAAGYLGGDWGYSLTAPKVLYDIPDIMRADKMEITELQLRDGDQRLTNCSTLTMSILTSVYPNADWERDDYGQLQVYAEHIQDNPDSPVDAVVEVGVGDRVDILVPGKWHLFQGWRTIDHSKPRYSGHAFLVLADHNGNVDQILEATSRKYSNGRMIGPRYKKVSLEALKQEYKAGIYMAVLKEG